ncbi:hypothetical protein FIBSPDRAFT_1053875 [Athelia psychrophila]|uniref:Uncharacterized protein n=1 Tax=Athelia psychrophila TaxID=1759441 RepID=A0A167W925_9AGAM|nr:hypothetical protein FIBSPDRAFT_1053875 [Fibularhizoctonia sp. CBS 109695]
MKHWLRNTKTGGASKELAERGHGGGLGHEAWGVLFENVFPNSITQYITFTSCGSPWPKQRGQQVSHSSVHPRPAIISIAQFPSTAVGAKPSFVYTAVSSISPNSSAQPVIWALASALPSDASPDTATHRPAQNYAHALLGLLIIALAFCQLGTGYMQEYPE